MLHQVQALIKISRIDDGKNSVGRLRTFHATEYHIDRDLFFKGMCSEPMCARKIHELDGLVVGFQLANMAFNRDARIIADTLSEPCQAIKKSALARIWTTDNRNAGIRLPAYGNIG